MKSKEEHGIEWAWTEMNREHWSSENKTITLDTWTKAVCIEMHLDRRRPGTLSLRAKPKESCCWYYWHLSWYWCWTFDLQECRSWFWHYTICFTRVFGISWFCCSFSHLLKASPLWNELQANPNGLLVGFNNRCVVCENKFPTNEWTERQLYKFINFNLPCRTTNLLLGCRNYLTATIIRVLFLKLHLWNKFPTQMCTNLWTNHRKPA